MGKRSAAGELFLGNMGSIQRETRPSIQGEDQLTMETKLEQIAAKARREPKLRFTSLAHHRGGGAAAAGGGGGGEEGRGEEEGERERERERETSGRERERGRGKEKDGE